MEATNKKVQISSLVTFLGLFLLLMLAVFGTKLFGESFDPSLLIRIIFGVLGGIIVVDSLFAIKRRLANKEPRNLWDWLRTLFSIGLSLIFILIGAGWVQFAGTSTPL